MHLDFKTVKADSLKERKKETALLTGENWIHKEGETDSDRDTSLVHDTYSKLQIPTDGPFSLCVKKELRKTMLCI
jgi:hypothetical protein